MYLWELYRALASCVGNLFGCWKYLLTPVGSSRKTKQDRVGFGLVLFFYLNTLEFVSQDNVTQSHSQKLSQNEIGFLEGRVYPVLFAIDKLLSCHAYIKEFITSFVAS